VWLTEKRENYRGRKEEIEQAMKLFQPEISRRLIIAGAAANTAVNLCENAL
jgi:hypothetical protein